MTSSAAQTRPPISADELKALDHPLRSQILELCETQALSGGQLTQVLGAMSATLRHHTGRLVDLGLLVQEAPARINGGPATAPYRTTGRGQLVVRWANAVTV